MLSKSTLLALFSAAFPLAIGREFEASMRRNLQVTTQTIGGYTYTCDLTSKAFSFGGSQDDQIVDVTVDSKGGGDLYACGNTYSTQYSSGD